MSSEVPLKTEQNQNENDNPETIPIYEGEPAQKVETENTHETEPMRDEEPTKRVNSQPAKLIRRADWGAKAPKWIDALEIPVKKVVLTWAETEPCQTEEACKNLVRKLQEAHMQEDGVPDIKHNFLVGGDGALYEGRGYTRVGPKYPISPRNSEELTGKSIEIAFLEKNEANLAQGVVEIVQDCISQGITNEYITQEVEIIYLKNGAIINKQLAKAKEVMERPVYK